ncbi:hypothetical protein GCM10009830_20650 [Glycomyces endophyticus]|uniref:Biopolymer transporter ExbD n=1 Tax=Glycomyces endophyticus TaxID=480996 RepID=A0ABN2GNT5_9ACTN
MMLKRRPRPGAASPSPVSLAGWLFADLALLLFIVTVAVAADFPPDDSAGSEAAATPDAAASPTPEPTPTAEPGVESEPHVFYVDTDAAGIVAGDADAEAALTAALRDDFEALVAQGYKVGFALTFGGAEEPAFGGDIAEASNRVLAEGFPELFGTAPMRHFWTSSNKDGIDVGTLQVELYLLAV